MQEIMGKWEPEEMFVIVDHQGQQGLDAAAYFLGHGLKQCAACGAELMRGV